MSQCLERPAPTVNHHPTEARHHFGKPALSPQENAEHREWERQARHFHGCPDCQAGEYRLESCRTCKGRGYYLPLAVARHLGVARFLYAEEGRVAK